MTASEAAQKIIDHEAARYARELMLDVLLYGKHPWPIDQRSAADPRNPKEKP